MRTLLILGAGGHGRVVAETARLVGFEKLIVLDDAFTERMQSGCLDIAGRVNDAPEWLAIAQGAIVALGDNKNRLELTAWLKKLGFTLQTLIHPRAVVSERTCIGGGSFIGAAAVIGVGTSIEDSVIINTNSSVDHDCQIASGVHVAPGASLSGNVSVGSRAWIGTGASVRQGIHIGDDVVVGVGAAVVSDLTAAGIYVGVPARPLDR